MWRILYALTIVLTLLASSDGHGRMTEPPSRASMFRFGFDNPANYNDNQMFCGGAQVQWKTYGGKCGVCGDSFAGPREHEAPTGKYANGIRVRKYRTNQEMLVRIHLTANHKGYFEFRLCQNEDPKKNVTQNCFNQNLLKDKKGASRFWVPSTKEFFAYNLSLPVGLTCASCVLQWKYNTGNSWGIDFVNKSGCIGCGEQEQFYACSDIAIGKADVSLGDSSGPIVVPAGDVDERTAWEEAEKEQTNNCNCKCEGHTSAGNDLIMTGSKFGHVVKIALLALTVVLQMQ